MTFSATVLVGDYCQLSGRPSPIRANRPEHRDDLSFDLPMPQAQGPSIFLGVLRSGVSLLNLEALDRWQVVKK